VVPARRSGGLLPYLVVLMLLAAAGAGAYWWFFLRGEGFDADGEIGAPPGAPSTVEQTEPIRPAPLVPEEQPAAPEAEITATLEAGPTQEQEVRSPRPGVAAWLAAAGSEVSEGAAVAKLDGYQRWDYAVKEAQESQRRYQEKLDEATAKGDKGAMKEAEANVRRKQGDIDRHTAELDRFLIKAPIGGLVEPLVKQRAQLKKDSPVAKILAQSEPRATFTLPPGTTHEGTEARVVARSDPGLAATCKVTSSDPDRLVVTCPTDSGLASGAEVVLKPR
jgi:multidrug efflux pump subunit AcrA (membrane-fusion protein)